MASNNSTGNSQESDVFACSNSSIIFFQAIAGLSIALGTVVAIFSFLAVLVTTMILKKHRVHVQRLMMYLNSAIFLQGTSTMMSGIAVLLIIASSSQNSDHVLCLAGAYLFNISLGMEIMLIWWITLDILLMAGFSLFTNKKMEAIQVLTSIFIPLSVMWVPFLFENYSTIDGRCDIVTHHSTNCTRDFAGFVLFLLLRLAPCSILLVVVFVMYTVVWCLLHRSRRRHGRADYNRMAEIKKLQWKVGVLVSYPIIYMLFYLVPSVLQFILEYVSPFDDVIMDANSHMALVTIAIVMENIGAILISVAFTFDKETLKQLCQCNQLAFWRGLKSSRDRGETVAIPYVSLGDSLIVGSKQATTHA